MSEVWYPPTEDCPAAGVIVIVQWCGRQLRAARWVKDGRYQGWAAVVDRKPVPLPPTREAARWGMEPEAWRPESPDLWKAPLPEPLVSCAPRMWSSRTRFAAVEDAAASELAREMEHDREAARARGADAASGGEPWASEAPQKQWWLDPHLVTYSPPGQITPREAEGRVMRALIAHRNIRIETPAGRSFCEILAAMARSVPQERADATADMVVISRPTGRDQDDMLQALGWLDGLWNEHRAVLALRAAEPPLSWSGIGRILGINGRQAQRRHVRAVQGLTHIANGGVTRLTTAKDKRLASIRRANRQHHLKDGA